MLRPAVCEQDGIARRHDEQATVVQPGEADQATHKRSSCQRGDSPKPRSVKKSSGWEPPAEDSLGDIGGPRYRPEKPIGTPPGGALTARLSATTGLGASDMS